MNLLSQSQRLIDDFQWLFESEQEILMLKGFCKIAVCASFYSVNQASRLLPYAVSMMTGISGITDKDGGLP